MASPDVPAVSVLATLNFNQQTLTIASGNLLAPGGVNNLVFNLTNPVVLGSIDDFIDWAVKEFGIPDFSSATITDAINEIPDSPQVFKNLKDALNALFTAQITITVLNINVGAGFYQLGVSITAQFQIFSFLSFQGIGIMLSKGSNLASPA